MKKFLTIILILFFIAILLVSCNTETLSESMPNESAENTTSHVHDFSGKLKYDENGHYSTCVCGEVSRSEHVEGDSLVAKKPNCVEEGQKIIACKDCDYRESISLPKLEHEHVKYEAVTATCIQKGVTAYEHCDICNIDIGKEVSPKISHDYKDEFCTMCGSHVPSEYIKFELGSNGWTVTFDGVAGTDRYDVPITELYIPTYTDTGEKVMAVGDFRNLMQLKKVILPEGIKYIGNSAFKDCTCLEEVMYLGEKSSELTIKGEAFSGCRELRKLELPEKCILVEGANFYLCKKLKSLDTLIIGGELGYNIFEGCVSLQKVTFADSVESVGWRTFQDCYSLKDVDLGNGITELSYEMFRGCSALETIVIPDSVTEIDSNVFYGCEKLKTVVLPKNLKSMRDFIFAACTSLESITIPKSVEYLGSVIFADCYLLKEIHYEGTIEDWNNIPNKGNKIFNDSPVERIICADGVIEL